MTEWMNHRQTDMQYSVNIMVYDDRDGTGTGKDTNRQAEWAISPILIDQLLASAIVACWPRTRNTEIY